MHEVGIGLIGAGFISSLHAEAFQLVPEAHLRGVAAATAASAEALRRAARHPDAPLRLPAPARRPRGRHRHGGRPERPAPRRHRRGRGGRQARDLREAARANARGGRRDDRRLPRRGRAPDVRRGAVLRAEVRAREAARRRGRARPRLPGEAGREALRPARRLVLGRRPVRRRRADGHGLPRASSSRAGSTASRRPSRSRPSWAPTSTATAPAARTTRSRPSSFDGNRVGLVETSWAKPGGMDDRAEIFGSEGVTYADLPARHALHDLQRGRLRLRGREGAATTRGWTFTMFEEIWNYGFPQEMPHFVELRAARRDAARDRRGRPGGARDPLRHVPRRRRAGRVALPLELTPERGRGRPGRGLVDVTTMGGAGHEAGADPDRRRRLGCDVGREGLDVDGWELVGCVDANPRRWPRCSACTATRPTAASRAVADAARATGATGALVVVPPHLHLPVALEAYEAGLHVLVEKPLADTMANGREMVARGRGRRPHPDGEPELPLQGRAARRGADPRRAVARRGHERDGRVPQGAALLAAGCPARLHALQAHRGHEHPPLRPDARGASATSRRPSTRRRATRN